MEYDVVDKAEQTIQRLGTDKQGKIRLSKSQIRKFLTAVNVVKNKVDVEQAKAANKALLSNEMEAEVKFLKVNILYQAGREPAVKDFENKAEISKIIADIGNDANKFNKFCKYVEALVAFHKFYGGKD